MLVFVHDFDSPAEKNNRTLPKTQYKCNDLIVIMGIVLME